MVAAPSTSTAPAPASASAAATTKPLFTDDIKDEKTSVLDSPIK